MKRKGRDSKGRDMKGMETMQWAEKLNKERDEGNGRAWQGRAGQSMALYSWVNRRKGQGRGGKEMERRGKGKRKKREKER